MYLYCNDDPLPSSPLDCVALQFVPDPSLLPALSIEDAGSILVAVCVLLATAWAFKQARRAI